MSLEESAVLKAEEESLDSIAGNPVQTTELTYTVNSEYGLHARPATKLTEALNRYEGEVEMRFQAYDGNKGFLHPEEKCENPKGVVELLICALEEKSKVYFKFTGEEPSAELKKELEDIFNGKYSKLLSP